MWFHHGIHWFALMHGNQMYPQPSSLRIVIKQVMLQSHPQISHLWLFQAAESALTSPGSPRVAERDGKGTTWFTLFYKMFSYVYDLYSPAMSHKLVHKYRTTSGLHHPSILQMRDSETMFFNYHYSSTVFYQMMWVALALNTRPKRQFICRVVKELHSSI